MNLSVILFACKSVSKSVSLQASLVVFESVCKPVGLSVSVCVSVCLCVYCLSVCLAVVHTMSVCLSVYLCSWCGAGGHAEASSGGALLSASLIWSLSFWLIRSLFFTALFKHINTRSSKLSISSLSTSIR